MKNGTQRGVGDTQKTVRGWAVCSLPLPPTWWRQAQLLLISKSDREEEIQPRLGHGHSPEQPASAKPERRRLGPQGDQQLLSSPGVPRPPMSAPIEGSDETEELKWLEEQNGREGILSQCPLSGRLACFFPSKFIHQYLGQI